MIIFTDLDGTIIEKNVVSPDSIKAFNDLNHFGHYTILASGRPLSGMIPLHQRIFKEVNEFNKYILCFNGAGVYDVELGEYIFDAGLNKLQIAAIIDEVAKIDLDVVLFAEDEMFTNNLKNEYALFEGQQNFTKISSKSYEQLKEVHSKKIMGVIDPQLAPLKKAQLIEVFQDNLTIVQSTPFFIEITKPKIDKGNAIEFLYKHLNLNKKVAFGFGDGDNDISMFKAVSHAIAMDNASENLKKYATHHTDSYANDGFAKYVNRYILNQEK